MGIAVELPVERSSASVDQVGLPVVSDFVLGIFEREQGIGEQIFVFRIAYVQICKGPKYFDRLGARAALCKNSALGDLRFNNHRVAGREAIADESERVLKSALRFCRLRLIAFENGNLEQYVG